MRTIKELLQLMLDNEQLFIRYGLCAWSRDLYYNNIITIQEFARLANYIGNNRPSQFSSIGAFFHYRDVYYWKKGDIKPRIKWLKKHIAKN